MTSSVTMAGLAPVGVKQQRARRVAAAGKDERVRRPLVDRGVEAP